MAARKVKLTKKRADWVSAGDRHLKGSPMRLNGRVASRLAALVQSKVTEMARDYKKTINDIASSDTARDYVDNAAPVETKKENMVAMDASITSRFSIAINALDRKWKKEFSDFAKTFSLKMITKVNKLAVIDSKASLEKLSGGMSIDTSTMSQTTKDIIRASSINSTSLIKTIQANYNSQVLEAVNRSVTSSNSSFGQLKQSINKALTGRYKVYKNKAKNIALDQTQKVYSNLARQKVKDAGVKKYIWRHSGGSQHPREDHIKMDGNVYSYDDPPVIDKRTGERGHPGDAIHCGCYEEPVIDFDN